MSTPEHAAADSDEPNRHSQSNRHTLQNYLTRTAHASTPFIATFVIIHLSAPAFANLGSSSLASQILGREYYQTSFGERYLLIAPFAAHTISGILKRLLTPSSMRRRFTSLLSITGYSALLFFLPVHYLTHRIYPSDPTPPIYSVGPAELDFEFVKVGLQTWPWRSWLLYIGLTTCVAWHAAAGANIIWSTWLRPYLGPGKSMKSRLVQTSLGVLPALSGLYFMSQEPLFAFSSLAERFQSALSTSFVYRI
ncbi:hypothetical protein QCA50_007525 [Cerrena zonata]|uniref:Mitochondrial adapter protein MCP1 transmembrane domain-containing protein n=1 Tax=Cerrena zonata TaxID=2478898 RepID=A0AAW0G649_9APHY